MGTVKADPDAIDGTHIPWGNGPAGRRLFALLLLIVLVTAVRTYDLSGRENVTLVIVGFGWGVAVWFFDRWWDRRPAIHMVDSRHFSEVKRYAPTLVLVFGPTLGAISASPDGASAVFASALFVVLFALVVPAWDKRRAARTSVRLDAVEARQ